MESSRRLRFEIIATANVITITVHACLVNHSELKLFTFTPNLRRAHRYNEFSGLDFVQQRSIDQNVGWCAVTNADEPKYLYYIWRLPALIRSLKYLFNIILV